MKTCILGNVKFTKFCLQKRNENINLNNIIWNARQLIQQWRNKKCLSECLIYTYNKENSNDTDANCSICPSIEIKNLKNHRFQRGNVSIFENRVKYFQIDCKYFEIRTICEQIRIDVEPAYCWMCTRGLLTCFCSLDYKLVNHAKRVNRKVFSNARVNNKNSCPQLNSTIPNFFRTLLGNFENRHVLWDVFFC